MDRGMNPHPEQITEEWASQFSPGWPTVPAEMEAQPREPQHQDIRERFHTLASTIGQIVWTARPDGMSYDAPFWRAYTGQSSEEVQGLGWMDAIHPADRERTCSVWLHAVATKKHYETEYRLRRFDGVYHSFLVRGVPLLDVGGNVLEWVGTCTDISERKQLEETLQESEAHFRATFEHAPVGIGNATLEGRWFDVNQRLCDMLGYPREELLARTFQEVTHPDDLEVSVEHHNRLLSGLCQSYALEKRYLRKDGSPIWVNLTVSLVRTVVGTPHHTIGIIEDIHQRKQIEEERAQLLEREQQARAQAEATTRRLWAMQKLTDTALTHLSVEDLLRELLDRIREIMLVDSTTILLLSDDGQFLRVHASRGLEEAAASHLRIPFGEGVAGKIAASRRPLIIDDLSEVEAADPLLQKKLCSLAGVPLLVKDRIIGVIHVGTAQPNRFTQDDVQLLETAAERIALAIDHAHLFQAEQQARVEAAARASQLEATIEAMTEGVGIYDSQGFSLLTNQSGRKILGIDAPDHFMQFTSWPHPERIALLNCRDKGGNPYPPARSPLTRALGGEVVTDAESEDMLITSLDGHERYLSSTAAPIRNAQGQLDGAVFVYRDVTERRLLESRTHEALSALLEMAEALIAPAAEERLFNEDTHTGLRLVTQRLAEMTARVMGYERVGIAAVEPESTQIVPLAVVSPSVEERDQWWARRSYAPRLSESKDPTLLDRFSAGEVMLLDTRNPPFSEPHPFNLPTLIIAPMRVGKQLVGLLSIGHDSAGHVYPPQEIALAGAVARLTALVIEREHLLRQREQAHASEMATREANRRMEDFLGIASHELKTPLTTIRLHLQLAERRLERLAAQEKSLAPGVAQEVARLRVQLRETQRQRVRLDRLVNDLLDVSRIQAGKLHLSLSPIDLEALVYSVVEEQCRVNPGRKISWFRPCNMRLPVLADAERISQVVMNYLSNAFKYAPEAAPIEVGITCEASQARVWVKDKGPGLTGEQQAHLWERFYRVPGVEVQSGSEVGMGLGLHICKTIIEQHQGQIGVESVAGKGSTFWFTLPLTRKQ